MELDKILVLIDGLAFCAFIYWYFIRYQNKETVISGNSISITVDGGYSPQTIKIKKNKKTNLVFTRKDPSSCLEEVVLPEFGKRAYLPLNKEISIEIKPTSAGVYEISCGMNMFHGKIIVEEAE